MIITSAFENVLVSLRGGGSGARLCVSAVCIPHLGTPRATFSDDNDDSKLKKAWCAHHEQGQILTLR